MLSFLTPRHRAIIALAAAAGLIPLAVLLLFGAADPSGNSWIKTFLGTESPADSRKADYPSSPVTFSPGAGTEEDALASEDDLDQAALAKSEGMLLTRLGLETRDELEGSGGEGIHRSVRYEGVWFPVFNAMNGGSGSGNENELSLYITSGSPPRFLVGESINYLFQAVGGLPPYEWSMEIASSAFSIDPETGEFSGHAEGAQILPLDIFVRDSLGAEDSASYVLTVEEGLPLSITSNELPIGSVGSRYQAALRASGGIAPYHWSVTGGMPEGFYLDPTSGLISGISEGGMDQDLEFRVTDAGGETATAILPLRITTTLEIVTSRNLPPASPGTPYQKIFEVEGGVPPYEFRIAQGDVPFDEEGRPWTFYPDGILEGIAPAIESSHRFIVEVIDSLGMVANKEFLLPIRRTLIVVPSRQKAGLAWSPAELGRMHGTSIGGFTVTRSLTPEPGAPATIVYQGTGSNFVDHGLATGNTYFYALYLHPAAGGDPIDAGRASARILSFTQNRATAGVNADPYADAIKEFHPLSTGGHGSGFLPGNVTGPPDGKGTFAPASLANEVLSLHASKTDSGGIGAAAGGSIILAFVDNIVELGPGEDFTVFENVFFINGNPNQRFMEPAIISVALFEGEWFRFPIDVVPPAGPSSTVPEMDPFYYNRGFAGRNATTGGNPTDPSQSGGDAFDIDQLGLSNLSWIRYIRIQSTGHLAIRDDFGGDSVRHLDLLGSLSGSGSSGFDLDAVTAINY
ncbi:MAG: hypothetical protein KDN20_12265 [Verrucomicrobiae bacterium]|nr:hypothetical protein [Verrucomicrobiae bacterium]